MIDVKNTKIDSLPTNFKPYFWSFDFEKLDIQKNKQTIILQILSYGNIKEWSQVFQIYGANQVEEVFKNSKIDNWNKKSYNFWKMKFS